MQISCFVGTGSSDNDDAACCGRADFLAVLCWLRVRVTGAQLAGRDARGRVMVHCLLEWLSEGALLAERPSPGVLLVDLLFSWNGQSEGAVLAERCE